MNVLVRILMMDSCTKPKYEIIWVRIIFNYLLRIRIKLKCYKKRCTFEVFCEKWNTVHNYNDPNPILSLTTVVIRFKTTLPSIILNKNYSFVNPLLGIV